MKAAVFALSGFVAGSVFAQVSVSTGATNVSINGGSVDVRSAESGHGGYASSTVVTSGGNMAGNSFSGIESGADVQGVSVINGRVFIDNQEIPPNVKRYKSPRTGTVYNIQRQGSSVQVSSE